MPANHLQSAMKKILSCIVLLPILLHAEEGFKPLFNGKTLAGWRNINCGPKTWTVKDA